jgi:hypothetical protein
MDKVDPITVEMIEKRLAQIHWIEVQNNWVLVVIAIGVAAIALKVWFFL